ncbi:MAG: carboxypeptidase regulatory-like domain-containing protein, partial [Rubrivivax sp.]
PHSKHLLLAALLFTCSLGAQAQSTAGSIVGKGQPGDVVMIASDNTGFSREVKVDADGKFKIRQVPIGTYRVVRKHADGSMDNALTVAVRPDGAARVPEAPVKAEEAAAPTAD